MHEFQRHRLLVRDANRLGVARSEGVDDRFLVREEVVERANARAGAVGDHLHRAAVHPELGEDQLGRVEDLLDPALPALLLRRTGRPELAGGVRKRDWVGGGRHGDLIIEDSIYY